MHDEIAAAPVGERLGALKLGHGAGSVRTVVPRQPVRLRHNR
jgi:hypothetical protein